MRPENFLTEYFEFYLYNGEAYFFYWNRWEELDNFIFLYDEIVAKIAVQALLEKQIKTDTLYAIKLEVYRNPDEPDEWYDYGGTTERISQKKALIEVPRIATEVRNLGIADCDAMADRLDGLYKLIQSHKLKTPI
jgi:hypothetical protein